MCDDILEVFSRPSKEYILPPRSRLYHLEPIGIGTPHVEQLTSYIHRLVEAHGVPLRVLVERELVPLLSTHYIRHAKEVPSFFYRAATLNGTNPTAHDWVRALERLTLRCDLHLLTMLPWVEVIPITRLLKPSRAWCATCLAEMRAENNIVYEPLLWALDVVTLCVRHQRRLDVVCPACQKFVPTLGVWGKAGYCLLCQQWLGTPSNETESTGQQLTSEEWCWQEFVHRALGNVLVHAVTLSNHPQPSTMVDVLRMCIEQVTGGNVMAFGRHVAIHGDEVRSWLRQTALPQLNLLLWVCYCLDRQPLEFWIPEKAKALAQSGIQLQRAQFVRLVPSARGEPQPIDQVQYLIQEILKRAEDPPPTFSDVARRVGVNRSVLRAKFPKEYSQITEEYQAYKKAKKARRIKHLSEHVRQAVRILVAQGASPTRSGIAKYIGVQTAFLDPEVDSAYIDELRLLGYQLP